MGKIKYVIVIVQENRTPDNLFQGLPGADIATSGYNSTGAKVTLASRSLTDSYDPGHFHQDFETDYAGGKLNGWDKDSGPSCPACLYSYVPKSEVQPYFTLAHTFTFADKTFQDNQGPSFPAHQFIISGTSTDKTGSKLFAAENPVYGSGTYLTANNCKGAASSYVQMINKAGKELVTRYPCFEHQTIMDLLKAKGITWRYYDAFSGGYWSAPDAIKHLRNTPADWKNVVAQKPGCVTKCVRIINDINAGKLAQVSWVTPTAAESDHGGFTDGSGPAYVASIVNAVGASKYWPNVAIFIVWDDWGGWYDHVPPVIYSSYEVGFRVPLIVVSPYAKLAYVSHVQHQQSSIIHFIEKTFNLGTLGYADARADDLSDCFNLSQIPIKYTYVSTPGWDKARLARSGASSNIPPDDDF